MISILKSKYRKSNSFLLNHILLKIFFLSENIVESNVIIIWILNDSNKFAALHITLFAFYQKHPRKHRVFGMESVQYQHHRFKIGIAAVRNRLAEMGAQGEIINWGLYYSALHV